MAWIDDFVEGAKAKFANTLNAVDAGQAAVNNAGANSGLVAATGQAINATGKIIGNAATDTAKVVGAPIVDFLRGLTGAAGAAPAAAAPAAGGALTDAQKRAIYAGTDFAAKKAAFDQSVAADAAIAKTIPTVAYPGVTSGGSNPAAQALIKLTQPVTVDAPTPVAKNVGGFEVLTPGVRSATPPMNLNIPQYDITKKDAMELAKMVMNRPAPKQMSAADVAGFAALKEINTQAAALEKAGKVNEANALRRSGALAVAKANPAAMLGVGAPLPDDN